ARWGIVFAVCAALSRTRQGFGADQSFLRYCSITRHFAEGLPSSTDQSFALGAHAVSHLSFSGGYDQFLHLHRTARVTHPAGAHPLSDRVGLQTRRLWHLQHPTLAS